MLRPRQYHLPRLVKRHLVFVLPGYDQPAFLIQNVRNALIPQTVDMKHGKQRLHADHTAHRNTVLRIPAVHIIFHPVMNKRPLRIRRILSPALPQRLRQRQIPPLQNACGKQRAAVENGHVFLIQIQIETGRLLVTDLQIPELFLYRRDFFEIPAVIRPDVCHLPPFLFILL